jgi:hypothetical protein
VAERIAVTEKRNDVKGAHALHKLLHRNAYSAGGLASHGGPDGQRRQSEEHGDVGVQARGGFHDAERSSVRPLSRFAFRI